MSACTAMKSAAPARAIVDGEFAMTEEDFRNIAAILHGEAGIVLAQSKATLAYSRLAKRLRVLGLSTFRDYCELVASGNDGGERQRMIAALTTNVTRFFREPHHFAHLRDEMLPRLVERARAGGRVRLWSAGCSTGQEAYSAAMTLLDLLPDAAGHDIRILATDIDADVIDEGKSGTYSNDAVSAVPLHQRTRWMTQTQSGWRMGEAARALVAFLELNLIGNWPMRGRFDAVFCRNVVIYFEEETQCRIWNRMAHVLEPHGVLYIGHSERVSGAGASRLKLAGTTIYRLAAESAP